MERVRNRPRHEKPFAILAASEVAQIQMSLQPRHDDQDQHQQDHAERERLKAQSAARVKNWPNTIEALRLRKDAERRERLEREEEGRRALDREEAQYQASKREAAIERANLILYEQDDRIKALNSKMLLSNVIEERQKQLELRAQKQEMEKQKEALWHAQLQDQLRKQKQKEDAEAAERAEKARQFQKLRKEQLEEAEETLRRTMKGAKEEGRAVRQTAEKEVQEDAEAQLRRKVEAQKLAHEYKQHNEELKRIKEEEERRAKAEEEKIQQFAKVKESQMVERKRRQEEKFRNDMARRQAQIDKQSELLMSLRQNAEERVERQIKEVAQETENKELEKKVKREREWAATVESRNRQLVVKEAKKKAEVDEQAAFRQQRTVAAELMTQEDHLERQQRREQEAKLQQFQKLQMEDKKKKEEAEKVQEKLEGETMKKALQAEEEMFTRYVDTVMSEYAAKGRTLPVLKGVRHGYGM